MSYNEVNDWMNQGLELEKECLARSVKKLITYASTSPCSNKMFKTSPWTNVGFLKLLF